MSSQPRENHTLHVEFGPRMTAGNPLPHPPGEAQMLCWLVFGEHAALLRDVSEPLMSSLPRENHTLQVESAPRMTAQNPLAHPLGKAQMLCWLVFGEHAALLRDVSEADNVIPA